MPLNSCTFNSFRGRCPLTPTGGATPRSHQEACTAPSTPGGFFPLKTNFMLYHACLLLEVVPTVGREKGEGVYI